MLSTARISKYSFRSQAMAFKSIKPYNDSHECKELRVLIGLQNELNSLWSCGGGTQETGEREWAGGVW